MKALKFTIESRYGYFKNYESNQVYMTYNYIPKTTILGILGAIIGLDGWRQMERNNKLEYWEELKNTKISLIPYKPYFETFIETINNSTGFQNKNGATANIKRQILQNPKFTILIQKDSIKDKYYNLIKCRLENGESEFPLCMGINNYKLNVVDVGEIELEKEEELDDLIINSLIKYEDIEEIYDENYDREEQYLSDVYLPVGYKKEDMGYKVERFIYTNHFVKIKDNVWKTKENLYYFY